MKSQHDLSTVDSNSMLNSCQFSNVIKRYLLSNFISFFYLGYWNDWLVKAHFLMFFSKNHLLFATYHLWWNNKYLFIINHLYFYICICISVLYRFCNPVNDLMFLEFKDNPKKGIMRWIYADLAMEKRIRRKRRWIRMKLVQQINR